MAVKPPPGSSPAFPGGESWRTRDLSGNVDDHSKAPLHKGISIRCYLAAQAMIGLLAQTDSDDNNEIVPMYDVRRSGGVFRELLAHDAVRCADALILELRKEPVAPCESTKS